MFKSIFDSFDDFSSTIKQSDNEVILTVPVPGFDKNDLVVEVENKILTVSGKEGNSFTFKKSFTISDTIDESEITGKCSKGLLELRLPKHSKKTSKTITIQ